MLGIGGGLLMVPFLYLLMDGPSWSGVIVPVEHHAALAHATSLAVIVPTALSGLRAFHREGMVSWTLVLPLGGIAAFSALVGVQVAVALPSPLLKTLFGVFLVLMGGRLFLPQDRGSAGGAPAARRMRWWVVLVAGALVGFLSALLGVGGGVVAVPILIHWAGLDLHRVVPASIGIILFAAPAGALGYVIAGSGTEGLPAGAIGFVHLPAALAMLPGAILMAPMGARWNRRMKVATLRVLFALLLLLVGVRLVWENGPQAVGALG